MFDVEVEILGKTSHFTNILNLSSDQNPADYIAQLFGEFFQGVKQGSL